jgi:hypothetical protein
MEEKHNLLVIFGAAGSGKDTAAQVITNELKGWQAASFAAPIKQMVELALPEISQEALWGTSSLRGTPQPSYPLGTTCVRCGNTDLSPQHVSEGAPDWVHSACENCGAQYPETITARLALESLGTDWARRLNPNIWIWQLLHRAKSSSLVVTDGRFRNEFGAIKAAGGKCVLLLRKYKYPGSDAHQSARELYEIPITDFDYVIDNRYSLADYRVALLGMVRSLFQKESP